MNQATGLLDGYDAEGARQRGSDPAPRRQWLLRATALLAAVVVLAGCAGEGEPGPTSAPTTPAAPTTTATQTPTPDAPTSGPEPTPLPEPARPAAMDRDDIEGAKAAAEYFLSLYPYVYATGDLEAWQEMSHPQCEFCRSTSENVTELFGRGGHAEVGAFTIEDVRADPPDKEFAHFRIQFEGTEGPSSAYSADGELEQSSSGGSGSYSFAVLRQDDTWLIRGARGESSER